MLAQLSNEYQNDVVDEYNQPQFVYFKNGYDRALEINDVTVGVALDALSSGWQSKVEQSKMTPSDALVAYYHLSDNDANSRVQAAKQKYGFANINKSLNNLITAYNKKSRSLQTQYQQTPGVEIEVDFKLTGNSEKSSISNDDNGNSHDYHFTNDIDSLTEISATTVDSYNYNYGFGSMNFAIANLTAHYRIKQIMSAGTFNEQYDAIKFKLPLQANIVINGKSQPLRYLIATDQALIVSSLATTTNDKDALTMAVDHIDGRLIVKNGRLLLVIDKVN